MGEGIILGLGDNTDYEIDWDSGIFERLIDEYGIHDSELRTDQPIGSERALVVSILGFLKGQSGGERFVESAQIIEDFARRFKNKITIGGTSVRAAIAMRKLGFTSALHLVTINDHVRRLIPQDGAWVCSNSEDSSYPHLIVQFRKDARVHAGDIDLKTSRANRIIYDNDPDNMNMALDPAFASLITDAKVFLISGFNAMQDRALLADRLERLRDIMRSLPKDALVFYEDACFHKQEFSMDVRAALLDLIDVYSLNEDELQAYLGRPVRLTDPEDVRSALHEVRRMLPGPVLVIHTRYWALAFGPDAERYEVALKGGITMATTRFRFGDDFSPADYAATERLPPEKIGSDFADAVNASAMGEICCLPSMEVSESDVTTIGLGDAFVGGFLPALVDR